jgi:bisphosphoglycerate-dependent phosphoglycerate mutase
MGLCNIPSLADCPVSENGVNQIKQAGARLHKDDFISFSGIQLVAHSPLERARKTSLGMLGRWSQIMMLVLFAHNHAVRVHRSLDLLPSISAGEQPNAEFKHSSE